MTKCSEFLEINTITCFVRRYFDVKCGFILFPKSRFSRAVTKLHSDDLRASVILLLVNKRHIQQEEKKKKQWKCSLVGYIAEVKHIAGIFKYFKEQCGGR